MLHIITFCVHRAYLNWSESKSCCSIITNAGWVHYKSKLISCYHLQGSQTYTNYMNQNMYKYKHLVAPPSYQIFQIITPLTDSLLIAYKQKRWEVREWKRLVLSPKLGTITHGTSPLGPRWEAAVMPVYKTEKTNTSARLCMPVGTMGQLQGRTPRLIKTLGLIIKIRAEAPSTLGVVSHFSLVWVKDNSILTEKPGVKQIQLQSSFPQTEMLFKINQKDNAKLAN